MKWDKRPQVVAEAVHASSPITLSIASTTGLKYRTLNCIECGSPFVERADDRTFVLGDQTQPEERHMSEGGIDAVCPKCRQGYTLVISKNVSKPAESIPLYMQTQTLFLAPTTEKHLRNVSCMECGYKFFSISDRISMVVDNFIPVELESPDKIGSVEVWCKFHYCKQRWSVRV